MNTPPPSWSLCQTLHLEGRPGQTAPVSSLELSPATSTYLSRKHQDGLYLHQHRGITALLAGENVCLATPTASGKTTVFHAAAMERLVKNPQARILALYPMKALGSEQEARWAAALEAAGITGEVGRIDGGVTGGARNDVCARARVLIATPDVVHTWLLPRVGQRGFEGATRFLRGLELVVVDEAHAYSGVFGSNAAFALRRLQHVAGILGKRPSFVAASATMRDAKGHVERLVGQPFTVIDETSDTSHRHPVEIEMVKPVEGADFHTAVAELLATLRDSGDQFVAFFDSRKASEQMAAILQRNEAPADEAEGFTHLLDHSVLPFRAGYEADHRAIIQERLTQGTLKGVVSTSTLELGLDLPHLKTVVLVGVPSSGTSLRQRIGRVGRNGPGRVIVVHSGTLGDELTFEQPEKLLDKPLHESTIYLDNRRVQYAHAMALARQDGEHDRALLAAGRSSGSLAESAASWPEGFLALCGLEREGRVPNDLRDMKRDAGEQPTHTFMLRDVEAQFDVERRTGMQRERLGSLSFSQVMREAYPGAVYYYTGRPYRVVSVDQRSRTVQVQRCPHYYTRPVPVRSRLTPQRAIHGGVRTGQLTVMEADLQIWRAVLGFKERRGSTTEQVAYPCAAPVRFAQPTFSRTLFTTGVCFAHPAMDEKGVDHEVLSALLLEAFLIAVPLERQDVDTDTDALRADWADLSKGRRFVALFDQASGSLRITARLRDPDVLRHVLDIMLQLVEERDTLIVGTEERHISAITKAAICAMADDSAHEVHLIESSELQAAAAERAHVLLPRSRGTSAARPGESFEVHKVFAHPTLGLVYRGVFIDAVGDRSEPTTVPVDSITPIEDGAVWGYYDLETGEQVAA
ncbi:MAG: DEAD/DEAH box helicase [Myxococcales bacterium]|nr:DEAD/DEAH box helicase [Myxococcales bacterium]